MGTVGVRICTACGRLAPESGECPHCKATPHETAEEREARITSAPLPDDVEAEISALNCDESDKAAIRAFARKLIRRRK